MDNQDMDTDNPDMDNQDQMKNAEVNITNNINFLNYEIMYTKKIAIRDL